MFKNYLKIAIRNLWRNKGFSIINISGLAIGMAAAILISLWVQNELSYDQFHKKTLYKVFNRTTGPGEIGAWDITAAPLGKTLQNDFPEIKNSSRIYWSIERLFNYGDKSIKAKGNDVDKPFLSMFNLPLLKGNAQHVFDNVNSIVLTESFAKRIFGDNDPMNKIIKVDNKESYKVTGVLKDLPSNTQFDFSYLVPLPEKEIYTNNSWDNNSYYTYVELQPDASIENVNKKIKIVPEKYAPGIGTELFLYPVSKMHLYSHFENGKPAGGRIEIVRLLVIIASLILLIACINFMNLSTAQSQKRAKEVGVRKVIGAGKRSLVSQFLIESILIALISGIFAVAIVEIALPAFNQLVSKSLTLHFESPWLWISLIAFILFTGLLAGSYPAFFLSKFKPVKVLKGFNQSVKNPFSARKILVVVQFSVAIILVVSTLVVYRQIRYVQSRDTGYNLTNLVEVPIEGDIMKNYELIKTELLNKGIVKAICKNSLGVTVDGSSVSGYSSEGANKEQENINFSRVGAYGDFIKTLDLTLLDGRDIDITNYPADSASVLLNETAVRKMGLKNPVGKYIQRGQEKRMIVGVFKDFIIGSPYENVNPMIVIGTKYWTYNLVMRFNSNNFSKNLSAAEQVFKKYNPAYPFTYHFVDKEYEQKFSDQKQTGTLAALFAGLTILISCLGLFGLAAYMAENRTKEIGIRKVLGASVAGIAGMISKEFIVLVIISIVIATPISWFVMNKWLQDYTYRIKLGFDIFLLAGVLAILIALITVSFQAIKAAIANPVRSLRSE